MTVFAVWGMTVSHAHEIAKKKTRTITEGGAIIPESEWLQRVKETTETIMRGKQIKQLSVKFDAPRFAREFLDIARRNGAHRDLRIRVWCPLTDDAGKPIYSKNGKKPRMGWADYLP